MKTVLASPLGKFSFLKEFHLETEMKGKHFDDLAIGDEEAFEQTAMSILKDLMEEDPQKLTQAELYYVFLVVKCASLGPKLKTTLQCPNKVERVTDAGNAVQVCSAKQVFEFGLNEGDVHYVPMDYVLPKITITIGGEDREFEVRPPKMCDELSLINDYSEQGVTRSQLLDFDKNRAISLDYTRNRLVLFLCQEGENQTDFVDKDKRAKVSTALLEENSLKKLQELTNAVKEVSSWGVENKTYTVICKECGGKIVFHLPMRAGLSL